MSAKRFLLSWLGLFVLALGWNAFVHLVVLRELNDSVQHLRRPDLIDKSWLSLVLTAGILAIFLLGYGRFARTGTAAEGLVYGASFAVLAGLLVDLNQYILYPIPASVAFCWFVAGLIEFSLYGALASKFLPTRRRL